MIRVFVTIATIILLSSCGKYDPQTDFKDHIKVAPVKKTLQDLNMDVERNYGDTRIAVVIENLNQSVSQDIDFIVAYLANNNPDIRVKVTKFNASIKNSMAKLKSDFYSYDMIIGPISSQTMEKLDQLAYSKHHKKLPIIIHLMRNKYNAYYYPKNKIIGFGMYMHNEIHAIINDQPKDATSILIAHKNAGYLQYKYRFDDFYEYNAYNFRSIMNVVHALRKQYKDSLALQSIKIALMTSNTLDLRSFISMLNEAEFNTDNIYYYGNISWLKSNILKIYPHFTAKILGPVKLKKSHDFTQEFHAVLGRKPTMVPYLIHDALYISSLINKACKMVELKSCMSRDFIISNISSKGLLLDFNISLLRQKIAFAKMA